MKATVTYRYIDMNLEGNLIYGPFSKIANIIKIYNIKLSKK